MQAVPSRGQGGLESLTRRHARPRGSIRLPCTCLSPPVTVSFCSHPSPEPLPSRVAGVRCALPCKPLVKAQPGPLPPDVLVGSLPRASCQPPRVPTGSSSGSTTP